MFSDQVVIYVSVGGVWKSTDGGKSWTPLTDLLANLAFNTLAQTSNTIYGGTGEGFLNIDAKRGAGIFKTTDGGDTWDWLTSTNNSDFYFVNKIQISTRSSSTVYLEKSARLFNRYAATSTGLWKSTNAGESFTSLLTGNTYDIATYNGGTADTIYTYVST